MFTINPSERETLSGEPTAEGVVTVPVADLKRLREQVTELQKRGTELVEENRRLKAELRDTIQQLDLAENELRGKFA